MPVQSTDEQQASLPYLDLDEDEHGGIEVEIDDPDYDPDDFEVELEATDPDEHYSNLVNFMDEDVLDEIGMEVIIGYEEDLASRENWEQTVIRGIQNTGLVFGETDATFEGACTASHPIIIENTVKYQSKASDHLLPSKGPVDVKILGRKTPEKEKRAYRVKSHMNHLMCTTMREYYGETEKMLWFVPLLGNGFKKKYWDEKKGRVCDEHIQPDRVIVNNLASCIDTAERITVIQYKSERELRSHINSMYFIEPEDVDLDAGYPEQTEFEEAIREITGLDFAQTGKSEVHTLIEQQCYLQLDEDTFEIDEKAEYKPYIVVVHKDTGKVLRICRNWVSYAEEGVYERFNYITHYQFVPGPGFYALGYTHLLGNIQDTLTVAMRCLIDSGQFANMQGGFKKKSAKFVGDNSPIGMGEFKDLDVPEDKISDVILPLPFKEPSAVLLAMLEKLEDRAQRFADATEQVVSDSTNYGPVGTTMALLEAGAKFFHAVHKRGFNAQQNEIEIIASFNYEFLEDELHIDIVEDEILIKRDDYDPRGVSVRPAADPNVDSQAQRISKAQAGFSVALQAPQHSDVKFALKQLFLALGAENAEDYVPDDKEPEEQGPIEDIIDALRGKPIAAFQGQDHQSHIAVKTAWLQNPEQGQSPTMQPFIPTIVSNIREHQIMEYVTKLGAMETQGIVLEEAAQQLARFAQIAEEERKQGGPAMILAQAEKTNSETNKAREDREAKQAQFKSGLDMIDSVTKLEQARNRAEEMGRKLDLEAINTGLNLIKEGMPEMQEDFDRPLKDKSE